MRIDFDDRGAPHRRTLSIPSLVRFGSELHPLGDSVVLSQTSGLKARHLELVFAQGPDIGAPVEARITNQTEGPSAVAFNVIPRSHWAPVHVKPAGSVIMTMPFTVYAGNTKFEVSF